MKKRNDKITELTHDTVPATVGLVKEVRDELRTDIRGVDHKIESLSHRVDSLEHKIDAVRNELKGDIQNVLSETQQILVAVHRSQVLMEEQRGENKIVLDGIKNLWERQNRMETDLQSLQPASNR